MPIHHTDLALCRPAEESLFLLREREPPTAVSLTGLYLALENC